MKHLTFTALLVLAAALSAETPELVKRGIYWQFGTNELSIRIHGKTGVWSRLSANGEILADGSTPYAFHLKTGEPAAIRNLLKTELQEIKKTAQDTLDVKVLASDGKPDTHTWTVVCRYKITGQELRQTFFVSRNGSGREKIQRFSQSSPFLKLTEKSRIKVPAGRLPEYRKGDIFVRRATESWGTFLLAEISPGRTILQYADFQPDHSDPIACGTIESAAGFQIGRDCRAMGWVNAGSVQQLGDFILKIVPGKLETAMRNLHEFLEEKGERLPAKRPAWLERASIYCTHPNGTIGGIPEGRSGFLELKNVNLPHVRDLGCTLYHILPVEDNFYAPVDYRALPVRRGTPDDYRAFVNAAHNAGIRVFQDIVPHGGMLYKSWNSKEINPRAKELEHLTGLRENGERCSSLIFDYDLPGWQLYMYDVAVWCMKQYGLDGLRIDAVTNTPHINWRPGKDVREGFSYHRGGWAMQRKIRNAVKAVRPEDGAVLAETSSSRHGQFSDLLYDFGLDCQIFPYFKTMSAEKFVPLLRDYLQGQYLSTPRGLLTMRYVESHDTIKAEPRWNLAPMRALFAVTAWSWGVPLVCDEMENGSGEIFRRILRLRRDLPELGSGKPDYLAPQVPDEIWACLRRGDETALPLVNFSDRKQHFQVNIPLRDLPESCRNLKNICDEWNDTAIPVSVNADSISIPVELPPYGMTLLRLTEKRAQVERTRFTAGTKTLTPDVFFLNPDGGISRDSKHFSLEKSAGDMILKLRNDTPPEGGLLLRIPVGNDNLCSWTARSVSGLHQDYWRIRFPNSTGVVGRYYTPQDCNVLWTSLANPFGLTPNEAWIGFETSDGSIRFEFDPAMLPGNVAILDHIPGAEKGPYLFVSFRAGRGALPGTSGNEIRFRQSGMNNPPLFENGTGDPRLSILPGKWQFDDGKTNLTIRGDGFGDLAIRKNGKMQTVLSGMEVIVSGLWSTKSAFRSSLALEETSKQVQKLPNGTLIIRMAALPRKNMRNGFWGLDRIVDYLAEYRFKPDGSAEFLLGIRPNASEYSDHFNVRFDYGVNGGNLLHPFPGQPAAADGKQSAVLFSGPVPPEQIGKWKFFGFTLGTPIRQIPDQPKNLSSPLFRYCMDPGFELCSLSAVRKTVQNLRPYFDWYYSTPSTHIAEAPSVQPDQPWLSVDVSHPYKGVACLAVTGGATPRFAAQPLRKSYFKAGSAWNFRGFFRTENLKSGALVVGELKSDGSFREIAHVQIQPGTADWKEYTLTFTVPENCEQLYCRIVNSGTGTLYADEFSFSPRAKQ